MTLARQRRIQKSKLPEFEQKIAEVLDGVWELELRIHVHSWSNGST
ncbi:MAG: hypothetical protein JWM35_111 [Verrucomicrobia bacterium]|nr:hypothetical protein [Verrucomicrobiota bacterium]